LLLLWRLRRGRSEGAAFLSALGLLAVSLNAIARGSGIHDVGMVVVAVLMMLSALLERRWQALVVVSGTAVGVWLVGRPRCWAGPASIGRWRRPGTTWWW
jgi:hypothetical protein